MTNAANLTLSTGGRVSIELIGSFADFSNTMSLNSPAGGVAASGCKLEPADGLGGTHLVSGKRSKIGCRLDLDANPATPEIDGFPAGTEFEFGMCAQTDSDADCEYVWSSDPAGNSDGDDHVQTTAVLDSAYPGRIFKLGWEDLENLGDGDFNDLIVVVRVANDADGDGLWDDWETHGIDANGDGVVDLALQNAPYNADPDHKDIFIEIDYMDCNETGGDCISGDGHSHEPKADALAAMVDAFDNAPVANPDGIDGITVHMFVDDALPHQNFLALGCGYGNSYDTIKSDPAYFGPDNPRRYAFHYVIFGHRQHASTTSSGCAELPGNDALITLGEWNTACIGAGANGTLNTTASGDDLAIGGAIFTGPDLVCDSTAAGDDVQWIATGGSPASDPDGDGLEDRTVGTVQQQAGTVMHEFGHNLKLRHGGFENTNRKPNYLSIMSYAFQTRGIPGDDPDGAGPLTATVDYSAEDLDDLDESDLDEGSGVDPLNVTDDTRFYCPSGVENTDPAAGPIDWNCDTDTNDTGVSSDTNGDGAIGVLQGFDDWDNLKLDFQSTADFEDGEHLNTIPEPMDFVLHLATNIAPVAQICPDTVTAECAGALTTVSLDGSCSFDPDGGSVLTYAWASATCALDSPADAMTQATCALGTHGVSLVVTDPELASSPEATATVNIVDTTPPVIQCNAPASITPPDAPITFTATATDTCETTAPAVVTGFDCYTFTKKGKRIDKRESCAVALNGDSIEILDSGGVGDHILWTVSATDGSGNTATADCEVLVENPGKQP